MNGDNITTPTTAVNVIFTHIVAYRKLLHGWMSQLLPVGLDAAAVRRSFSRTKAFLLPNSFIDSRLSEGWEKERSCSRTYWPHVLRSDGRWIAVVAGTDCGDLDAGASLTWSVVWGRDGTVCSGDQWSVCGVVTSGHCMQWWPVVGWRAVRTAPVRRPFAVTSPSSQPRPPRLSSFGGAAVKFEVCLWRADRRRRRRAVGGLLCRQRRRWHSDHANTSGGASQPRRSATSGEDRWLSDLGVVGRDAGGSSVDKDHLRSTCDWRSADAVLLWRSRRCSVHRRWTTLRWRHNHFARRVQRQRAADGGTVGNQLGRRIHSSVLRALAC